HGQEEEMTYGAAVPPSRLASWPARSCPRSRSRPGAVGEGLERGREGMNVIRERSAAWLIGIGMLGAAASLLTVPAPADELPSYLRDRGPGSPTSMSGTYVRKGELLVYPFFEYYYDNNTEYTPSSLGHVGDQTFHAKYRAAEGILVWGYGINERVGGE